ncbi:hypothetical protein [Streptacidiphilus sp. MAP12-33]|uniref:hypothetical protein n=1 Tax=Streptacidiphilus sp. MAP12-33 TaxID=3156266 RepID=UPI003514CF7C
MPHRIPPLAVSAGAALALACAPILALAPAAVASSGTPASPVKPAVPANGVNGADISISPENVTPGRTVGLVVNCSASFFGTPDPTLVSSMAFVTAVRVHPMPGQPGFFSGAATISSDVKPGSYSVSGACKESNTSLSTFRGEVEVHSRHDDGRHDDNRHPHGPVHTGVGGSIDPGSTTQVAVGLGLAGLAGGALFLSRRRGGAN